jgi:hypothetical protein
MSSHELSLQATFLDFVIDPNTGDRIRWSWDFPLDDFEYYQHMTVELDARSIAKKYAIYPKQPCECFASDFILCINHALKRIIPEWTKKGNDPGRLACDGLIDGEFYLKSGDLFSSTLAEIGYACPDSPTGAIYTWLYPKGDEWVLSVTTLISSLDFPDHDDATAKAMALECYEKHYAVLYQHAVSRATLEQWREQARAFLRQVYSHMDTPIEVP